MDIDAETTQNPSIVRNRVLVVGNLDQNALVGSLLKNPSVSWTDSFGGKLCKHSLDNKYYTAELEFLTFGPESLHTSPTHLEEFGPTVDALLLSFDSHDSSILNTLRNSWISHWIDEQDPNILLALTNTDVESDTFNDELREWCFENGMELIDISTDQDNATPIKSSALPQKDGDDDEEDEDEDGFAFFQREERTGFDRVFEAIESHTWSHMKLKNEQATSSSAAAKERQERVDEGLNNFLQMLSAIDLEDADNADEAAIEKNLDNFEATLLNLRAMRERASGLPDLDRREMAAEVALAFASIMNEHEDRDEYAAAADDDDED